MRAYDNGDYFKVTASRPDIDSFASRWPCCTLHKPLYFRFHKGTGDLVDTNLDDASDGSAAVALAEDCLQYGIRRLRLRELAALRIGVQ